MSILPKHKNRKEIPEMVSEDSVWSRRPGFKYQLWTCIKLCPFIFI